MSATLAPARGIFPTMQRARPYVSLPLALALAACGTTSTPTPPRALPAPAPSKRPVIARSRPPRPDPVPPPKAPDFCHAELDECPRISELQARRRKDREALAAATAAARETLARLAELLADPGVPLPKARTDVEVDLASSAPEAHRVRIRVRFQVAGWQSWRHGPELATLRGQLASSGWTERQGPTRYVCWQEGGGAASRIPVPSEALDGLRFVRPPPMPVELVALDEARTLVAARRQLWHPGPGVRSGARDCAVSISLSSGATASLQSELALSDAELCRMKRVEPRFLSDPSDARQTWAIEPVAGL